MRRGWRIASRAAAEIKADVALPQARPRIGGDWPPGFYRTTATMTRDGRELSQKVVETTVE